GSSERASSSTPSVSSARTGWQEPSEAIPGFPGAACSSLSVRLSLSFHASACSRPPDPTSSTFTAASVSDRPEARITFVVVEPGLDMHEWETEWAQLEEAMQESPV